MDDSSLFVLLFRIYPPLSTLPSGRDKFFIEKFKPIKTTACEGNVCGYVYFPCTSENRCLDVMNGRW